MQPPSEDQRITLWILGTGTAVAVVPTWIFTAIGSDTMLRVWDTVRLVAFLPCLVGVAWWLARRPLIRSDMTAKIHADLWCDHPECADADGYAPGIRDFKTIAAVRADASKQGWTHRDGKDFCPDHSEAP
jgi:hypothetical protein